MSDTTGTAFDRDAWETPSMDHISAELFVMSYSPPEEFLIIHTAMGSGRAWMLQNHAQAQAPIDPHRLT